MGQILFLPATIPVEITPEDVTLAPALDGLPVGGERICVPADFVVLTTGYSADMRLFEMLGVQLTGPERAPVFNAETLETNVPGVYVAGTVAGGTQKKLPCLSRPLTRISPRSSRPFKDKIHYLSRQIIKTCHN
jgi:thioredoxin reductase (NADPH)